jgi:hypothetical protein
MLAKIKFSKIAVVLFLTILIWVWTDLALDETYDVTGATITLTESTPRLWISFDGKHTIDVNNISLKGPASKITNIRRKIEDHSFSLLFALDAEKEGLVESGEPLNVQSYLQKSAQLQDSGLTVESCKPAEIQVRVIELTEKTLGVECFDESKALLTAESIVDPATVKILVPPDDWPPDDWSPDDWPPGDKAGVMLTRAEIDQAKKEPIQKKAHIELADSRTRESSTTVEIRIPPEDERLRKFTDITATIGYCLSENLLGRYTVELLNQPEVIGEPIKIRATSEAKARYEQQDEYKMTLYIYDEDVGQEALSREVHYNFPLEYVYNGDIVLDQTPVTAQFKLIPSPSAENP